MSVRPSYMHFIRAGTAALLFTLGSFSVSAQETAAPNLPAHPAVAAQTQDVLRAYLQVQEQLHAVQMSIERNQQDAQDIAARNVKALGEQLNSLQQTVGKQRDAEFQALQNSNRFMLIITGALVLLGLVVVFFAYLQWKAMHRFTEVALNLQMQHQLGGRSAAMIDANEPRLLGVIDRLEKRIRELEQGNHLPLPSGEAAHITNGNGTAEGGDHPADESAIPLSQVALLLNKGQSLLSLGQSEAALACFDEILAKEPTNVEALIKKGTAFEKMQKFNEAVACYDRAIEADRTVTIAYLYKGGVFNRMERYNEALECYEQALKTQDKAKAA